MIDVSQRYGVCLPMPWTQPTLELLDQACADFLGACKLPEGQHPGWMHGLQIRLEAIAYGGLTSKGLVRLCPNGLSKWTIVHELAHAWDFAAGNETLAPNAAFHSQLGAGTDTARCLP